MATLDSTLPSPVSAPHQERHEAPPAPTDATADSGAEQTMTMTPTRPVPKTRLRAAAEVRRCKEHVLTALSKEKRLPVDAATLASIGAAFEAYAHDVERGRGAAKKKGVASKYNLFIGDAIRRIRAESGVDAKSAMVQATALWRAQKAAAARPAEVVI